MIQFLKNIWYAQRNAKVRKLYFDELTHQGAKSIIMYSALVDIELMRTPKANATVIRMAKRAGEALDFCCKHRKRPS